MRNADAIRNLGQILAHQPANPRVVVVSAMGKTTNALEELLHAWFDGQEWHKQRDEVFSFHKNILNELFPGGTPDGLLFDNLWQEFEAVLAQDPGADFDMAYDQVVSYGELFSTAIVEAWLGASGMASEWVDVRNVIRTSSDHRKASVDWHRTAKNGSVLKSYLAEEDCSVVVTQGFIGSGPLGNTTTLGREGSDFSASILAHITDAEKVVIWKDVEGMRNADPSWFNNTVRLPSISFREAIELSYYGASVMHPKTIQPLQEKGIELHIKSFLKPDAPGTLVQAETESDHLIPSYIFKGDQVLVSISRRDLTFVAEQHLSDIFGVLSSIGVSINLMQLSALNFSMVIDGDARRLERLMEMLAKGYEVRYNKGVKLLTIRHYTAATVADLTKGQEILLEQKTRSTLRLVMREED